MDTPRPASPPRSGTRGSLQFVSPTKTVLFSSPDPPSATQATPSATRLSTASRAIRSPSSIVAQTPASSFSSKLRRELSPPESSSSTLSATSKVNRLFSDYEKQKELDEVRFSRRIRELEEERNRAMGESEAVMIELDKSRQLELRARKENDDLKEKVYQLRKDLELRKREEEANRRLHQSEVEELKRIIDRIEADRAEAEKEAKQAKELVDTVEVELREERDRFAGKVEAACRRAVEKERAEWEKDHSMKSAHLQDELDAAKKKHREDASQLADVQHELEDVKRQLEKARRETESERSEARAQLASKDQSFQAELEAIKSKLILADSSRRKLDRELEDTRSREQTLVAELQNERSRTQEKLDLACRRAVEKEREESKLQQQLAGREEERRRKELEDELDDAKTRLAQAQLEMIKLEKSLDDMKKYADRVHSELEAERQSSEQRMENAVKRAVEREQAIKTTAIEQVSARFQQELEDAKKTVGRVQDSNAHLGSEVDALRKQLERARLDVEQLQDVHREEMNSRARDEENKRRGLSAEVESLGKQLVQAENRLKRSEKDFEELKNLTILLEEELESERKRSLIASEAAAKRAVEKDRLDRRAQMEQAQREEEKRRRSVEKELEETKMRLFQVETHGAKTENAVQMQNETVERLRAELEQERQAFNDQLETTNRRLEKERKAWAQERQDYDRLVQDLEQRQLNLLQEKESILGMQEDHEREFIEVQNQLKEAAIREERLLLDIAELRGRHTGRLLSSPSVAPPTSETIKLVRRPLEPMSLPIKSVTSSVDSTSKFRLPPARPISPRVAVGSPPTAPPSLHSRVMSSYPIPNPSSSSLRPRSGSASGLAGLSRRVANAKRYIDSDWN